METGHGSLTGTEEERGDVGGRGVREDQVERWRKEDK